MEFLAVAAAAVLVFLAWHLAEYLERMAKCAERNADYREREITLQEAYAARDFADADDDDDFDGFDDDDASPSPSSTPPRHLLN